MVHDLRKNFNRSFLIPLGVAASCFLGIFTHSTLPNGDFMVSIFKAFTIQSNIWAGSIALLGLGFSLFNPKKALPAWLEPIRFMFTSAITLTWLVFAILLTPTMSLSYLLSQSNFYLHSLTPILSVIDYIRQPEDNVPFKNIWTVMIMPILYSLYFFLEYAYTGEMPVRYFFMDYRKHGWFGISRKGLGVVYWMILLLTTLVGIGRGLLALRELGRKDALKTSLWTGGIMLLISALMVLLRSRMPSTEKDSSD